MITIRNLSLFAGIIFLGLFTPLLTQSALAASAVDWQAGNIMSDGTFTNSSAMQASEIQAWLDERLANCDINGTQRSELGGGTRAQYGADNGNPTPFTCLNNYYEVPKTIPGPNLPANNYGGKPIPTGAKSAAQLIADAANAYNINPKVLLVKLATESAGPLTSDTWPFLRQYTYAMGSHCPDSGPGGSASCDSNYAGFSIQIYSSAQLLRYYLDNMEAPWWPYKRPFQTNSILWNVAQTGCGASDVYIQSKATAALYTYTPYQPNQAALNNMYGSGDRCSAYGNRNFWRVFSDWFGSPHGVEYAWGTGGQYLYLDSQRTVLLPYEPTVTPNQTFYAVVKARNTGTATWLNSNTFLATSNPKDRGSPFYNNSWTSSNRVAQLSEGTVRPGEVGTFTLPLTAPGSVGSYKEHFNIVIEGKTWLNDIGLYIPIQVKTARSIEFYSDTARKEKINISKTRLYPHQRIYAKLEAVNNTSDQFSESTRLATTKPIDRSSVFYDHSWISPNRIASVQKDTPPGNVARIDFTIKAADTQGEYTESLGMVQEGKYWIEEDTISFKLAIDQQPADRLSVGDTLIGGESIKAVSPSLKAATLVLQNDGNLVLYSASGSAVWASNTLGKYAAKTLVLQNDGNLVLYSASGSAVWASNTLGKYAAKTLILQNDGNLVLYSASGSAVWASNTTQ